MSETGDDRVVIVGAGLAGLAMATSLARAGYSVSVVESAPDAEAAPGQAARSINLALSARGLRTLALLGINGTTSDLSVPMRGRCVHVVGPPGEGEFQSYDLIGTRAIYSIKRSALWHRLHREAATAGVQVIFGRRCERVVFDTQSILLADGAGRVESVRYGALIGADGLNSVVRRGIHDARRLEDPVRLLSHGYVEMTVPADRAEELRSNALHVWPRGDAMLVMLPNVDGSCTATLFWRWDNRQAANANGDRSALLALFARSFDAVGALVPNWRASLTRNPIARVARCQTKIWTHAERVVLIGDAAHTMAPFYGQGLNCALEDVYLLAENMRGAGGVAKHAFARFAASRQHDAEAIMRLSDANYREMSRSVADPRYLVRRLAEQMLQQEFPDLYSPLYSLVAFSTIPYAQAVALAAGTKPIVDMLCGKDGNITVDCLHEAERRLRLLAADAEPASINQ